MKPFFNRWSACLLVALICCIFLLALILVHSAYAQGTAPCGFGVSCQTVVAAAPQGAAADVGGIETDILEALGAVILSLLTWLAKRIAQKVGIDKNAAAMQALDSALARAVNAGVSAAQQEIVTKGWTHIDTKNTIVNNAVQSALDHAQTAIKQAGYDPTTPEGKAAISQRVSAMLPAVAPQVFTPAPGAAAAAV